MNNDPEHYVTVAILSKAPLPGLSKTRLIPRLGADGAAALQRWLLQRAVATAVIADVGPVVLWCTPDIRHPDFQRCRTFGPVSLRLQPVGDLGLRMFTAIAESPSRAGTLVIGTDCPMLTPALLQRAASTLSKRDTVVVPAEDGGYVLIGMREASESVFGGIDWGTDRVMRQTRRMLDISGRQWSELDTLWDVDRPADFERLLAMFPDMPDFASLRGEQA